MAWVVYDAFLTRCYGTGTKVDFTVDTVNLLLCTASYTPDQTNHDFRNDLGANEVSGTGYSAGGVSPGTITATVASHVLTIDCPDIVFAQSASGFSNARYAVLAKITGGASSTDPLIAYYDLGADRGNVAGALTLATPNGLFVTP